MLNKKVYCKNCAFCKALPGNIFLTYFRIVHKAYNPHIGSYEYKVSRDCFPAVENKNNNCPFYKHKWWKFWVK